MRTGILTFHSAHNFGASLQAWALQTTLERLGVTPFVVNYRPAVIDDVYNPMAGKTGLAGSALVRSVISPDVMRKRRRYERFIRTHFRLTQEAHTFEELRACDLDLDACIVGSDQVWNTQHMAGDPAYFLGFLGDNVRRISYAASVGTEYVLPPYHETFREGLANLDAISVREESAREVLKPFTDKRIEVTLDPTLLLDVEEYDALKRPVHYGEEYILVYMIEKNPQLISLANRASKVLGLPVVQRKPWHYFSHELKSVYTCTPEEFLGCVEGAKLVLTNSFHGTVFSILYGKPFISMLHSDTGSRTVNLLHTLGLESHLMYESDRDSWVERLRFDNQEEVRERIVKNRESSLEFLRRGLGLQCD